MISRRLIFIVQSDFFILSKLDLLQAFNKQINMTMTHIICEIIITNKTTIMTEYSKTVTVLKESIAADV